MQEVEPGWNEIARITWFLVWRAAVGGFVASFVLGLIVNLVAGYAFGVVMSTGVNLAIGAGIAIIWWPIVVRMALKKNFQGFRLALIATGV
jgi:hypothetical protein